MKREKEQMPEQHVFVIATESGMPFFPDSVDFEESLNGRPEQN